MNYLAVKYVGEDVHIIKEFGDDVAKAEAFCKANGYAITHKKRLARYQKCGMLKNIVK